MSSANNTIIDDTVYAASGRVVFNSQPGNNDTVTINGKVYTFQTALTNVNGHVKIGANVSETAENLAAAIGCYAAPSILGPQPGVNYAAATTAHTTVTGSVGRLWGADAGLDVAGAFKPIVGLFADTAGVAGNAYGLAYASPTGQSAITVVGFSGGTNGLTIDGYQDVVTWHGGYCDIFVSGVFGGASVTLLCCTKIPASGNVADIADEDWVPLAAAVTENGKYSNPLNPCLLSANVSGTTGTSALRILVQ